MKRNAQKRKLVLILLIISGFIAFCLFVFSLFYTSPKTHAKETVDMFYQFEQSGNFAESWELFHPLMQEKFSKGHYVEDRAHVFMNHFDVSTFSYQLDNAEKIEGWKMEEDAEVIDEVYMIPVYQLFEGKYGNFTIMQKVYVAELDGEWRILWDYNR